MALQQRFPTSQRQPGVPESPVEGTLAPVEATLAEVRNEPPGGRLVVGDDRVVAFLVALARRLLAPSVARSFPELTSLGFFLRKAEIRRALGDLADQAGPAGGPARLRFPRGLVH